MADNEIVNNKISENELSLLSLVPQVMRARDFRLYTKDGMRLIDLWQNGGAAVLGHTPAMFLREIKNTAGRGLYAPFPHFTEQRLHKVLSMLFPDRSFRLYAVPPAEISFPSVYEIAYNNGVSGDNAGRLSPVLWRPFLDFCTQVETQRPEAAAQNTEAPAAGPAQKPNTPALVIPVLPGIQGWRGGLPFGLCVYAVLSTCEEIFSALPPTDFLPPVALAAAARGIWDLIAAAPERGNIQWQHINKVIKNSPWQRRGIYLFPRLTPGPKAWELLFRSFLDAGFLLPPLPGHPLILPGILSPGEEAKLAEILQTSMSG